MDKTDIKLVKSAQNGDIESLDILIEKYMWLAVSKARRHYLAGGAYEDLLQEGLLGLVRAVKDYDPEKNESLVAFMSACVTSKIIDAVRKSRRNKQKPLNAAKDIEEIGNSAALPGEYVHDPLKTFLEQEEADGFYEKLSKVLNKEQIDVLKYYLEGYSYQEIAALMNTTAKKIDNTLYSVKNKVKKQLTMNK